MEPVRIAARTKARGALGPRFTVQGDDVPDVESVFRILFFVMEENVMSIARCPSQSVLVALALVAGILLAEQAPAGPPSSFKSSQPPRGKANAFLQKVREATTVKEVQQALEASALSREEFDEVCRELAKPSYKSKLQRIRSGASPVEVPGKPASRGAGSGAVAIPSYVRQRLSPSRTVPSKPVKGPGDEPAIQRVATGDLEDLLIPNHQCDIEVHGKAFLGSVRKVTLVSPPAERTRWAETLRISTTRSNFGQRVERVFVMVPAKLEERRYGHATLEVTNKGGETVVRSVTYSRLVRRTLQASERLRGHPGPGGASKFLSMFLQPFPPESGRGARVRYECRNGHDFSAPAAESVRCATCDLPARVDPYSGPLALPVGWTVETPRLVYRPRTEDTSVILFDLPEPGGDAAGRVSGVAWNSNRQPLFIYLTVLVYGPEIYWPD